MTFRNHFHLFGLWGLAAVAIAVSGCNMDIREYCEDKISCLDGNDADEDACVKELEGREDVADEYDCEDQFDAAMECRASNSECIEEKWGTYFSDGEECSEKNSKYYRCIENASAIGGQDG